VIKIVFAVLLACGVAAVLPAQMLTRFAVVDLSRVYSVFFMDSAPVRALEARSAEVQAEINRMTQEIQGMQAARAAALAAGDQTQALRLEEQMRGRTEFLREFHAVRTAELEAERRALSQADNFLRDIYSEIRFVAEREGFSMVFDLGATPGVLWFSPTVDITDSLIQRLQSRPR